MLRTDHPTWITVETNFVVEDTLCVSIMIVEHQLFISCMLVGSSEFLHFGVRQNVDIPIVLSIGTAVILTVERFPALAVSSHLQGYTGLRWLCGWHHLNYRY